MCVSRGFSVCVCVCVCLLGFVCVCVVGFCVCVCVCVSWGGVFKVWLLPQMLQDSVLMYPA